MVRQLATKDFKVKINQVIERTALVVGDPDLQGFFSQLDGALRESAAVNELIRSSKYESTLLQRSSAAEILQAMFSKSYKIMHLAGHGTFSAEPGEPTGMLIGDNAFLTPCEISQMSSVPELVFVNCCYLGQTDGVAERASQNLHQMAANIGTELIDKGVKAVIVAGWAVNDRAALDFATEFYENMLGGAAFGDAVKKARKLIYERYKRDNTWGAYQCYGDPFYKLDAPEDEEWQISYEFTIVDEAEIKLSNLLNKLDTGDFDELIALRSIDAIAAALKTAGIGRSIKVIELEAFIMAGLNRYEESLKRFDELFKAGKANFSIGSIEKYCNIRVKYYLSQYVKDPKLAAELAAKTESVVEELLFLMKHYGTTDERLNLVGSAFKRKAMMLKGKHKQVAYRTAATYYLKALKLKANNAWYPLTNWMSIENALVLAGATTWKEVSGTRKEAWQMLEDMLDANEARIASADEMDFWDITAKANLLLCMMLVDDKKVSYDAVLGAYRATWEIAGHLGHKQAEIEHLDFLEDALRMADGGKADKLVAMIGSLKNTLNSMM